MRRIIPSAIIAGALIEWRVDEGWWQASKRPEPPGTGLPEALSTELARLADSTQALGAELHLNRNAAIERERRLLNVWLPHAASKIVSVADIVAKRRFFAAELTLCHDKTNLLDQRRALRDTIVTLSLDYTIFGASWQTRVTFLIIGRNQ